MSIKKEMLCFYSFDMDMGMALKTVKEIMRKILINSEMAQTVMIKRVLRVTIRTKRKNKRNRLR